MALSDMEEYSAMTTATTSELSTARKAFSLGIAVYAVAWAGVFVFVYRVFGIDLPAILLSLILAVPLVVAVRMRCRWPALRGREFVFLLLLVIFASGGGVFVIQHLYDTCRDLMRTEDRRFDEFTRIAHADPAFRDINFLTVSSKRFRQIQGTVATQADLDRFQTLFHEYHFPFYLVEVSVRDGSKQERK